LSLLDTIHRRFSSVPPAASAGALPDLSWVDEFIARVRPYIFVRSRDQLLIKRPNQAQKLNATGIAILQHLLEGASIRSLVERLKQDPAKVRQLGLFLFEVRRFLEGSLTSANASAAVELEPLATNFSSFPVLSEIALTYGCHLRCRFCYAGCDGTRRLVGDAREMTTDEVKRVLRVIRHEAEVPSVSFTGGEPTLRRDLPEIIEHAKRLSMRVNLITNGTLIDAVVAQRLAEAGLDSAQVSLEGTTATTHDRITGSPGSFASSTAAVGHLARAGIHVHSNTTINRLNLDECPGMARFVSQELGRERFSMNLVIPTGNAADDPGLVVPYREVGEVLDRIIDESRREGVEFMWYSPTPLCLFNPIPRGLGNKGCAACDGLLSVAPNGDVLPCSSYDDRVGNLLSEPFEAIWESKRARWYREKQFAHPRCRACEHFAVCHGACPLYWRALGFSELTGVGPHPDGAACSVTCNTR